MNFKSKKKLIIVSLFIITLMISLTIFSILYYNKATEIQIKNNLSSETKYKRHYAFIASDSESAFKVKIFESAKKRAVENGVFVELFGNNLATNYSKEELMKIAINAKVDGIILEADGSNETLELIETAYKENIPVVTILNDSYKSKRISFVGASNYALGQEYAREIIRISTKNTKKVLILTNLKKEDTGQNTIYTGIQETLFNEGNHLNIELQILSVDNKSAFGAEETIREEFSKDDMPDIVICLNEENTLSIIRAVVDFNIVGKLNIIGYSTSSTILSAIERNIVSGTISIDPETIGISAIDSLEEYKNTGYVNDFVAINTNTITNKNEGEYFKDESDF